MCQVIQRIKGLVHNQNFMRYAKNSSWMLCEYALRIISVFFVTIFVARYLGPEQFGVLNYCLAVVAIFMVTGRLGMESILVRDITKYPEQQQTYMGTAFVLMMAASIIGCFLLFNLVYIQEDDPETQLYIWIISVGIIFQTFLVIDYNFQAQVKAKYSAIAKSVALLISSGIKIILVSIQADLYFIAIAYAFDPIVVAAILILVHKQRQHFFFLAFRRELVRPLLKSSLPMTLASLSTVLFMKTDQVMIKWLSGSRELGLYVSAVKVNEAWILIISILGLSLTPYLAQKKRDDIRRYRSALATFFTCFVWSSIVIATLVILLGDKILLVSFGERFLPAHTAMAILSIANIFSSVGTLCNRIMSIDLLESKIAKRYMIAFILNISLNAIMIPYFGIEGASISSMVSIIFASYIFLYLDKKTRHIYHLVNKGFIFSGITKQ